MALKALAFNCTLKTSPAPRGLLRMRVGKWRRVAQSYVWNSTIMPLGKMSSTLAWRWAMPCSWV